MACPYFYPVASSGPARVIRPLGDVWTGECRAGGSPDAPTVRDLCNLGYARSRCPHCTGEGPDAVRFSIAAHGGGAISIRCVLEKDYLPFWHGTLEYSIADGGVSAAPGEVVARQAAAYAQSYLRRKEPS